MGKTKTIVSVIAAAIAVLLLAGCSADALMGTGKALGSLRYATADNGGDEKMEAATRSVEGFVERYENLIDWEKWVQNGGKRYINTEGEERVEGDLSMRSDIDSRKLFSDLMKEITDNIIAAKDSSSSDKDLKAALNTPYKDYDGVKKAYAGKTTAWYSHKSMRHVINVFPNVAAITMMVVPTGSDKIQKVYAYDSPFPIQGSEIAFIATEAFYGLLPRMAAFLQDLIQALGKPSESKPFPISDFKYILDNIASATKDRTDVTVGDKIVMCMVLDIINTTVDGLVKYADSHPGSGAERFDDLTAEWLLANCSEGIDRIYSDLEVVGYIYDCNIDFAAMIGKLL